MSVMYPCVIALEFAFVKGTVRLAALKRGVLEGGNLWVIDEEKRRGGVSTDKEEICDKGKETAMVRETCGLPSPASSDDTIVAHCPGGPASKGTGDEPWKMKDESMVVTRQSSLNDLERQYLGRTREDRL